MRWHTAPISSPPAAPLEIVVTQHEDTAADGLSDVHLAAATVMIYNEPDELSATQARTIGEALLRAADLADSINAGVAP